jgi:hypothetical protein
MNERDERARNPIRHAGVVDLRRYRDFPFIEGGITMKRRTAVKTAALPDAAPHAAFPIKTLLAAVALALALLSIAGAGHA